MRSPGHAGAWDDEAIHVFDSLDRHVKTPPNEQIGQDVAKHDVLQKTILANKHEDFRQDDRIDRIKTRKNGSRIFHPDNPVNPV